MSLLKASSHSQESMQRMQEVCESWSDGQLHGNCVVQTQQDQCTYQLRDCSSTHKT
ncbi:mCG147140 [Mus musculus]|nr:mCG147140 [Mus musculus]